jgi:hypothetical protein
MLEEVAFQNPPLRELLFKLSDTFKFLYIPPPRAINIQIAPLNRIQRAGESNQMELEAYNEVRKFLNSDEDSNWMEVYFKDAIDDEWGPAGYVSNEIELPSTSSKRKFSDMTSSKIRFNQGGTFTPSVPSSEVDESEDATMDEIEEYEEQDDESVEANDDDDDDDDYLPSSSRRRIR